MTFILHNYKHYYVKPYIQNNNNNFFMNQNNNETINTFYNPIIGSSLGIPLNLLQYIFTTSYYHNNIINLQLILLQFSIAIFTYGTDRFFDALDYKKFNNLIEKPNIISNEKINYYNYLNSNFNLNILVIFGSYLYILNSLIENDSTYIFIPLITSTLFYKNLKKNYGYLKSTYIALFWTLGTIILPCVLHDNNYEILNHPIIYLPNILTMFALSNLIDIKDIEEDKKDNINTIPVLYGENLTICLSHFSILIGLLLFNYNDLHDYEFIKTIFFLQNFGTFFFNNSLK